MEQYRVVQVAEDEAEEEVAEVGLRRSSHESRLITSHDDKQIATTICSGIESIDTCFQSAITIAEKTINTQIVSAAPSPPPSDESLLVLPHNGHGQVTHSSTENIISDTQIFSAAPNPPPSDESLLVLSHNGHGHVTSSFNEKIINTTQISQHGNGSIGHMQQTSLQDQTDLYLDNAFPRQPTQEFYCPNCNCSIRKVVLRDRDWQSGVSHDPQPVQLPTPPPIRCTSCFTFLIPAGSWFFPSFIRGEEDEPETTPLPDQQPDSSKGEVPSAETGHDQDKAPSGVTPTAKVDQPVGITEEPPKLDSKQDPPSLDQIVIIGGRGIPSVDKPEEKITGPTTDETSKKEDRTEPTVVGGPAEAELPESTPGIAAGTSREPVIVATPEPRGIDKVEVLKSIVYGGLVESITSLSIVTSAASSDVSSLDIVAMSLANLIGGFLVIVHNLWDLKAEQPGKTTSETNEQVDRYQELLGQRKNFPLHVTLALLSFLVFGLIPPVVYGFSFRESDDKDYKLAAVAGASLLCIALLAIGKAHIQRPSSYRTYLKTLMYYIVIGFMASGVSYVAGDLIKKLIDKLGLFKSSELSISLANDGVSSVKPTWSSI